MTDFIVILGVVIFSLVPEFEEVQKVVVGSLSLFQILTRIKSKLVLWISLPMLSGRMHLVLWKMLLYLVL
ncbi:hypothetical protein Tco_1041701 [Tanacetum coccineum]|uniref:Uncharacterized protein n=1 Tax=Tanacetum coccineum TaxID=301880 RepID=A0ABQ5GHG2_9ASTR